MSPRPELPTDSRRERVGTAVRVVGGWGVCLGLATALSACAASPALPSPAPPGPTTGASPARHLAPLPRCAPTDYAYGLNKNGAQGALILNGAVGYRRGPECRVHDEVVLRLTDPRGNLLPVHGNPVRTWIAAVVGTHTQNETHPVVYAWRNWCTKTPTSYALTISSSAHFARYRWRVSEPECVDAAKPSTLRRFTERG